MLRLHWPLLGIWSRPFGVGLLSRGDRFRVKVVGCTGQTQCEISKDPRGEVEPPGHLNICPLVIAL